MTEMYETCSQEIHAHRSRQEELAQHVEELVSQLQSERTSREQAENELDEADNEHNAELRKQQRIIEDKESALQGVLADLARTQSLLSQREADLQAVQQGLQTLEAESKRLGETHTTARFSLQLETDRMKRDMERLESELARARQDLSDKDAKTRERDSLLDKLHADNRDLQTQLGVQTQARLNVSEKLDVVLGNLKDKEEELGVLKKRVNDLEGRLEKDQRTLLGQESQYRDQVTERNTLLLTIYQYLDKIIGVDKTPVSDFFLFSLVVFPNCVCRKKVVKLKPNHSPISVFSMTILSPDLKLLVRFKWTLKDDAKRLKAASMKSWEI